MNIPFLSLPKPVSDALMRGDTHRLIRYLAANHRPSRASMTKQLHP